MVEVRKDEVVPETGALAMNVEEASEMCRAHEESIPQQAQVEEAVVATAVEVLTGVAPQVILLLWLLRKAKQAGGNRPRHRPDAILSLLHNTRSASCVYRFTC